MKRSIETLVSVSTAIAMWTITSCLAAPAVGAEAQWIWSPEHDRNSVPQISCAFRKWFVVSAPKSGEIVINADDKYELYLNGRLIAKGEMDDRLDRYNITRYLMRGKNLLAVKVVNTSGPTAALAARVLVKDASRGAGRGNQFLENVRNCDALVHVVRCFEDPNVAHVSGTIDPAADIRTVNLELILADMETCEHALQRLRKQAKREAEAKKAVGALEKIHARLDAEEPVRGLELSSEERESVRDLDSLFTLRLDRFDLSGSGDTLLDQPVGVIRDRIAGLPLGFQR